jgi:hypothetical protein
MQHQVLESARLKAIEAVKRRRIEAVMVQERTLNDRPTPIMVISKGLEVFHLVRDWFVRVILPVLSVDIEAIIEIA